MKKQVNIFICHNPFHIFVVKQICTTKFAFLDFQNVVISTVKPKEKIENLEHLWIPQKMPGRLVKMYKAKRMINRYSRNFRDHAEFFLPHVGGVLSNYIFKSMPLLRNGSKVNFYYEGSVMVDPKREERNIQRFVFQKTVLSALLLHRFRDQLDMLPLYSPRVNKIYTPYSERTQAPEERKELISFPRTTIQSKKGGILIIGVDAGEYHEESVRNLIQFIRENKSYQSVFFKPHYADREKVFQNFSDQACFQYALVEDPRCIEEVIGGLEVETVICMHFSSALLNLKSIYKDNLNVIFLAHPKLLTLLGEEFVGVISSMGVEIVPQVTHEDTKR